MARRQSGQGRFAGAGTGPTGPRETEGQGARRRQAARGTKPPGLVTRENELRQAEAQLRVLQSSGVARSGQISSATADRDRAQTQVTRQQAAARAAGRPDS
ncbi:MAG: hypothetical protein KAJ42_14375 [Gemmatimonadetes bacterium]|nr:hypothetical protein [Gemmatimonadota bacterium]